MMLDFYAIHDPSPFPEDLPAERTSVGSMDIEEYHSAAETLHACLARIGVDASHFSDWIVPADQLGEVLRCIERSSQDVTQEAQRALATFAAIVRGAGGFSLLAVCD